MLTKRCVLNASTKVLGTFFLFIEDIEFEIQDFNNSNEIIPLNLTAIFLKTLTCSSTVKSKILTLPSK